FGRHFEAPLLWQSIIMIITMLLMLKLCTEVRVANELSAKRRCFAAADSKDEEVKAAPRRSYLDGADVDQWGHLQDCLLHPEPGPFPVLHLWAAAGAWLLAAFQLWLGALLGVPSLLSSSSSSLLLRSVKMVLMWTSGDTFKTVYFILNQAPFQFSICGLLQVLVDMAILLQVYLYSSYPQKPVSHPTHPASTKAL
ncbi:PQ-loop repeat-containing protein 1, partial [Dryobates pubescens]